MAAKKIGRPTDCVKDIDIKFRFDKNTAAILQECSDKMGISRAEVVRRGIRKMHEDLKK